MTTSQAREQDARTGDAAFSQPPTSLVSSASRDISGNGNSPEGLRQRRQPQTPNRDPESNSNKKTWILPIFQYEVCGPRCLQASIVDHIFLAQKIYSFAGPCTDSANRGTFASGTAQKSSIFKSKWICLMRRNLLASKLDTLRRQVEYADSSQCEA